MHLDKLYAIKVTIKEMHAAVNLIIHTKFVVVNFCTLPKKTASHDKIKHIGVKKKKKE